MRKRNNEYGYSAVSRTSGEDEKGCIARLGQEIALESQTLVEAENEVGGGRSSRNDSPIGVRHKTRRLNATRTGQGRYTGNHCNEWPALVVYRPGYCERSSAGYAKQRVRA